METRGVIPSLLNTFHALRTTVLQLVEVASSPAARPNVGALYTKAGNTLYFRDGDGTENTLYPASAKPTKVYSDIGTDTTTNTAYEDFLDLSVSVVVDYTSNVLLLLTMGSVAHSVNDTLLYAIINWNGSDEPTTEIPIFSAPGVAGRTSSGASSLLKASVSAGTYVLKVRIKVGAAGTGTYTNVTVSAIVVPV